jgi:hypothetical protein
MIPTTMTCDDRVSAWNRCLPYAMRLVRPRRQTNARRGLSPGLLQKGIGLLATLIIRGPRPAEVIVCTLCPASLR